jgi:hypothetical protein
VASHGATSCGVGIKGQPGVQRSGIVNTNPALPSVGVAEIVQVEDDGDAARPGAAHQFQ